MLTLCVCAVPWVPARADDTGDAATKLTGEAGRDWLLGDVVSWMGSGDTCSSGQVYHFSKDKTVRIEDCVAGKRQVSTLAWTVKSDPPLDVLLELPDKSYKIVFYMKEGHQHLILREQGASKIDPTVDHDFVLSED